MQDGEGRKIRLGVLSKGCMVEDTLGLLKDCGLPVTRDNDRQYSAEIPQLPNVEVCFHRPKEIVTLLVSGHLDVGIVSSYAVSEYGPGDDDLITVHNALGYGHCHLSLAIPKNGIFERINSVKELAQMPHWTEENPLRVVTGLPNLGRKFMKENGLKHVSILTADGALEGFPQRGGADVILDIVCSGTTLRANNFKEIEGGTVLVSQVVLVARRKSLMQREDVRDTTQQIFERVEAHLKAVCQFTVTANGRSAKEVAKQVCNQPSLSGLQFPIPNPYLVLCKRNGEVVGDHNAMVGCIPKTKFYSSVQQLKADRGSRVLVSPSTYIFNEEALGWQQLLSKFGL
ncbi:ATP phosphoribosyltransferase 2, chloroplastic-like [Eucalyptus grandis]|uniref:ATP phosphoribosyltransferase 2, chloroplastic-like n=1 Tax=Eucalyptus grandis TaxID=71139 RepID=UPI00192EA9C4|nr:ATP phosphoribosyltransferase 2, chloroplastic-like [Eucalyptus grandis]